MTIAIRASAAAIESGASRRGRARSVVRLRPSLAGGPVEQLAGAVGVSGVPRGLVDQVQQHPAQIAVMTPQTGLCQRGAPNRPC